MRQNQLKTIVALSLGCVVLMAAAVSAHGKVREIQSTWVTLERAVTIVQQVLGDGGALRPAPLRQNEIAAVATLQDAPPPAPSAPTPPRSEPAPRPATPPRVVPVPPTAPEPPERNDAFERRNVRPIVRIGQGVTVGPNDEVSDVVVVGGPLRVEGRVRGDVVVVLGTVELTSTSIVDGDFVNVAGGVTAQPGAKVGGDMVTVGGAFNGPAGFAPSGEQMILGSDQIGQRIQAFIPWVTQGLMWGRLIVPSLPWVWVFVAITFFLSLLISILFEPAVRSCSTVVAAKPLTSLLNGVLVLLLLGPVAVILAFTFVGLLVLPFLVCALLVVGKVAVARWLGFSILPEDEDGGRWAPVRSVAIGLVVITLLYMVPVLGLVTWTLLSVLGLGAATSALFKALRRENPAAPKPPKPVPAAPVPPPPTMPFAGTEGTALGAEPLAYSQAAAPISGGVPPYVAPDLSYAQADPYGAELLTLPRATLMQRVVAGALDAFLVFIVFLLMDINRKELFWFLTLLTAYNAAFWTWRGTTIGGIILQLRVVRLDGRPMVFGDSLVRGLSSVFSLLVFGLGFLWIGLDSNKDRQAWHDLIAGTVVVRVPKSVPLR